MSRTQRSGGSSSPVKRYLKFQGGTGQIGWYDKNAPEDERQKGVESLDFVLLDIKSSITGYNEATSESISSNLLDPYSTGKEEFEVKLGNKVVKKGIWKDIKKDLGQNYKFTTNIFALADVTGQGQEVVRLELSGSSLSPWIEFQQELGDSIFDKKITISKGILCTRKDGETVPVSDTEYKKMVADIQKNPMAPRKVVFYDSKFSSVDLTEAEVDEAVKADEGLQAYFDSIGLKPTTESAEKEDVASNTKPEPAKGLLEDSSDLPF